MSRKLEHELELRIAMRAIRSLLAAGYSISVNDGEEIVLRRSTRIQDIRKALASTDEDFIYAHKADKPTAFVRLIWGNVQDVISDYSVSLEPYMASAMELAEKYD